MSEKYYTVDQIAEILKIHPKTIQRYIREGKLKAVKMGKSWRVSGHDLSVFTETAAPLPQAQSVRDKIKISSVIDIDIYDIDEATRIINALTAALNFKPAEYGTSTMQAQIIQPEHKVRIMLWGSVNFMEDMLHFLSVLTQQE